jgi:hypothetical protein
VDQADFSHRAAGITSRRRTSFQERSRDAIAITIDPDRLVTSHRPAPAVSTSTQHRLGLRRNDLEIVESASSAIADLGVELDRHLAMERRPSERMRMLREATNRITRTANDAVHAYRRASRAIKTELERPDVNVEAAELMRARLDEARGRVLQALAVASERYPQVGDREAADPPIEDRSVG